MISMTFHMSTHPIQGMFLPANALQDALYAGHAVRY